MPARDQPLAIPIPLPARDYELAGRLSAFSACVNAMLLDALAWQMLRDSAFCSKDCPHALADVKATAIVFGVLTKENWNRDDLARIIHRIETKRPSVAF